MKVNWKRLARTALLVLGVALLAFAIHRTGPRVILNAAREALPFLPAIMFFNVAFYSFEALAQRQMLGASASQVPKSAIVRAMLSAFVTSLLFPLGRAGAEVVRTGVLAPYVGAPRSSAASAAFQIPAMFGIGVLGSSVFAASASELGFFHPLTIAVLVHTLISVGFGAFLLILSRNVGLGSALLRRFPKFQASALAFDQALRSRPSDYLIGSVYCVLARMAEVGQYTVVLAALSVPLAFPRVLLANGIHVVSATAGEFIPGQLGTVESAYMYFAPVLGLAHNSGRAVSIALLVRIAQYVEAVLALVVLQLWPRPREARVAS